MHKMSRYLTVGILSSLLISCGQQEMNSMSQPSTNSEVEGMYMQRALSATPAFPGAMGFGRMATGGRFAIRADGTVQRGRVLKVTHTRDDGSVGSFRWAVQNQSGPRIVIFTVGGLISLSDEVRVIYPNLTIAGQTAPGNKGIAIRGARLVIQASNVIVRGLRFRVGDRPEGDPTYDDRDGISVGNREKLISKVILDSNSVAWSVDESISLWGNLRDITASNNLVGEALYNSPHSKGHHSKAFIIGQAPITADRNWPGPNRVSMIRNVIGNSRYRCPLVKRATNTEIVNNYCFNFHHFVETAEGNRVHFIKNFYEYGSGSDTNTRPMQLGASNTKYYLNSNLDTRFRKTNTQVQTAVAQGNLSTVQGSTLFAKAYTDEKLPGNLKNFLFPRVGARWPARDATDQRLIDDFTAKRGQWIDSQNDKGGWETYTRGTYPTDTDGDGMPDAFERKMGYNINVNDASVDSNGDGFLNIEHYINGIIDGSSAPAPTPTANIKVEAEAMSVLEGFRLVLNVPSASGTKILQSTITARARYVFNGPTGNYRVRVYYYDENDGVAKMQIRKNGSTFSNWNWNKNLGSANPNADTRTFYTSGVISLTAGDRIDLVGVPDIGEPVRTDAFVLIKQ